jgi:TolA-binding protein
VSRAAILLMTLAVALTAPGLARGQAAELARVEALVTAGDYTAARAGLERWWSTHDSGRLPGPQRARALMLRAQLASDPAAAEADYLSVVLGYPLSPDAPQALLRLGQGLLAVGEPARAAGYLSRLVADYPGRPERSVGVLWLARAHHAARQHAAACAVARDGLRDGTSADLSDMLRAEERVACARAERADGASATTPAASAPPAPAQQATATPDPPARSPPAARTPAGSAAAGRFAVQTGAYREQKSVDDAVAGLRRAGYDPRVVLVPGSSLIRVRIGRVGTSQEAATLMARVKRDGFDAVVVTDADRERRP